MIADNGRVPCTLQQVGDVYGVTRMAINLQIKDSLFPKLMMLFKKIIRDVKTVDDTSTR